MLGVPKSKIDEDEMNHHDVCRVKIEGLSWWLRNKSFSWEAITEALQRNDVQENNLALDICSKYTTEGTLCDLHIHAKLLCKSD